MRSKTFDRVDLEHAESLQQQIELTGLPRTATGTLPEALRRQCDTARSGGGELLDHGPDSSHGVGQARSAPF